MTLTADTRTEPEHTGIIKIMSQEGDTPVTWAVADREQVANARRHFTRTRGLGCMAYKIERDARGKITDREQIHAFDEALSEIVMVPPRQGG